MKFYLVAGLIGLSLLTGCSNSSTHGTEKDLEVNLTINNSGGGNVNITSPLTLDSASETAQDTANTATTTPTTRLQLTEGGSTAAGEASTLSDIVSQLKQKLNSENKTETKTNQGGQTSTEIKDSDKEDNVKEQVDTGKEEVSEDLDWKNKATFTSYGKRNGDRYAWRIAGKGPSFGEPIKLVFSSGKTYIVKDTDKNCRGDNPDTCDIPSNQNKDGFVFKPGIGPNGEGDTNTGTSHAGVYLQGPYGDSSTSVTIYYNKP